MTCSGTRNHSLGFTGGPCPYCRKRPGTRTGTLPRRRVERPVPIWLLRFLRHSCDCDTTEGHFSLSVTRFLLVPHGEDGRCFTIKAVQGDVAAVPEVDEPFTERRVHILDWATHLWLLREHLHAGADRLCRAPRSVCILQCKKAVEALHVIKRGRRPYHPWHWGGSASSPASSFASHASASSCVACWPLVW